jgi:hypothetical protein
MDGLDHEPISKVPGSEIKSLGGAAFGRFGPACTTREIQSSLREISRRTKRHSAGGRNDSRDEDADGPHDGAPTIGKTQS